MKIFTLVVCLLLPLWVQTANQKVVLGIQNMTCSLYVVSVNQALRETDGVIKAKPSLKARQAETIVPKGFPTDTLPNTVVRMGYTATLNHIERQQTTYGWFYCVFPV